MKIHGTGLCGGHGDGAGLMHGDMQRGAWWQQGGTGLMHGDM